MLDYVALRIADAKKNEVNGFTNQWLSTTLEDAMYHSWDEKNLISTLQ
jgi:hypothetical protein